MKVLLINDYGAQMGGAETYVINLKKGLEENGHIVKILTSNALCNKKHFNDYSFKAINQNSVFRIFPYIFNFDSLKQINKIMRVFKPDIVHLNYIFYHTSPSILLSLKNIPTIMTTHSQEIISPVGLDYSKECNHEFLYSCSKCSGLKYFPEKFKRIIFRRLAKNINLFITPSKFYKEYFEKNNIKPMRHLYNGIFRKSYEPINNFNNILFVGRLVEGKGAMSIIRAMPEIIYNMPNIKLTLVGTGPEENKLKNKARELKLEKNISFAGEVKNEDISTYYRASTVVVVLPTYPDNLPTVCLEAMSIGRPIIASNIGGLKELVRDGVSGYLVNPNDDVGLAKKIISLIENKILLKKMSKNAREFSKEFDISSHVVKIEEIYRQLLNTVNSIL